MMRISRIIYRIKRIPDCSKIYQVLSETYKNCFLPFRYFIQLSLSQDLSVTSRNPFIEHSINIIYTSSLFKGRNCNNSVLKNEKFRIFVYKGKLRFHQWICLEELDQYGSNPIVLFLENGTHCTVASTC